VNRGRDGIYRDGIGRHHQEIHRSTTRLRHINTKLGIDEQQADAWTDAFIEEGDQKRIIPRGTNTELNSKCVNKYSEGYGMSAVKKGD